MPRQKGSILIYILVAIFMTGILIASMTQGAKKSATTSQMDEMSLYLQGDIKTVQAAIGECLQTYPAPTDVNADGAISAADNPNPPLPLYGVNEDTLANLSSGGTGTALANIRCPGAPDNQRTVFTGSMGNKFKMLGNTTTYTTTYITDATEGAYIRITRATPESLWTEAIARLNNKTSACSAAAVTAAGTCANGCFYFWFVRRPTSAIGGEAGCP